MNPVSRTSHNHIWVFLQQFGRRLYVQEQAAHVLDFLLGDFGLPLGVCHHPGGGQQLHDVPQTGIGSDLTQEGQGLRGQLDALGGSPNGEDFHELFESVVGGLDDQESVEQVDGNSVGGDHVGAPDGADTPVGGQDDDRGEGGLKGPVEEGEALDVQHVHLVDEEDSGHQLGYPLVDVPVHHLVDLPSQLLSHFCLFGLHYLPHQAHEVVSALGPCVGHVQVVKSHILHDLLFLVHVALGQGDVLLSLQVEFTRVGVASAHPLDVAGRGLDVDYIPNRTLLPSQVLVNRGVKFELLGPLRCFEGNYDAGDYLVARGQVVSLLGLELGDLALPDLLSLFDLDADRPPEVFHEHLSLLDFR